MSLRTVTISVAFAVTAGTGMAADMPIKAPPVVAAVLPNWTGFYAGAEFGGRWTDASWRTTSIRNPAVPPVAADAAETLESNGLRGAIYGGYNWQVDRWVWGVEGDIGFSRNAGRTTDIPGTFLLPPAATDNLRITTDWDGSLRLRGGVLLTPRALLYATGGVAFQQVTTSADCVTGTPFCVAAHAQDSATTILVGWTAGVGFEAAIGGGWLARTEYRFSDYGSYNRTFFAGTTDQVQGHANITTQSFSVGLGYKFGGAELAQASAMAAGKMPVKALPKVAVPSEWKVADLTFDGSIGVLHGEANELVYTDETGRALLSKLVWQLRNVPVFNAGVTWQPFSRVSLGLKGRVAIDDPSTMDDFDYNLPGCPGANQTCHSNHPDTRVRHADSIDIFGAAHIVQTGMFRLSAIAGYKWDYYKWDAYDGTANYGPLPPGLGITYELWWKAPYVGLEGGVISGPWFLNARLIGSWWVESEDRDDHRLRSILFIDKFNRSSMMSATFTGGYNVSRNLAVTFDYEFQNWETAKGSTLAIDYANHISDVFGGNSAGANLQSHRFSFGAKYRL